MTDHPIIFSAPMVLALLDGRKTMTRRLAWRACKLCGDKTATCRGPHHPSIWQKVTPGDRLYVRENFALVGGGDPGLPIYAANWREDARARGFQNIPAKPPKWTPCIHMPRWASRLTLEVTAVKIEPLRSISYEDIVAEGAKDPFSQDTAAIPGPAARDAWEEKAEYAWERLWVTLHGQESWDANPEVVAISFKVHNCNIDKLPT